MPHPSHDGRPWGHHSLTSHPDVTNQRHTGHSMRTQQTPSKHSSQPDQLSRDLDRPPLQPGPGATTARTSLTRCWPSDINRLSSPALSLLPRHSLSLLYSLSTHTSIQVTPLYSTSFSVRNPPLHPSRVFPQTLDPSLNPSKRTHFLQGIEIFFPGCHVLGHSPKSVHTRGMERRFPLLNFP